MISLIARFLRATILQIKKVDNQKNAGIISGVFMPKKEKFPVALILFNATTLQKIFFYDTICSPFRRTVCSTKQGDTNEKI